jgi:POT family proton-dependent oligopeptide transporter
LLAWLPRGLWWLAVGDKRPTDRQGCLDARVSITLGGSRRRTSPHHTLLADAMSESPYKSPQAKSSHDAPEGNAHYQTTPFAIATMPPGIPYIVGNEAAERFSFYGMKSILTIFMMKYLLDANGGDAFMTETSAKAVMGWFVAVTYATPFIGAIMADWLWGKYNTILWVSLLYCVGHAVLALLDVGPALGIDGKYILYAGLALLAVGAGGIKPCVSAHVGDQFGAMNKHLLPRVYSWFYFSINFGSFFATLLTPVLLEYYGPGWAFGVPGLLMAVATFMFWLGRNKFVHVQPSGDKFWTETFSPEGISSLINLIPLLLFVAMFWSLFDQTASTWVIQADKMDTTVNLNLGFFSVERLLPSQIQAANPALILVLIPIFAYVIYPAMGMLFTVTPLRKIGIGLFVAAVSFAIAGVIEARIQQGETPNILWQVIPYIVITSAEVMVSITMLEFFYTQAPNRMKSFVMAFCMLSVSIGNVFTGVVNTFIEGKDGEVLLPGASYYWFFTIAMLVVACGYVVWSQFYKGRTYIQDEVPEAIEGVTE